MRAQPAPSPREPSAERTALAFIRCNGWLGSAYNFGNFQPLVPRAGFDGAQPIVNRCGLGIGDVWFPETP